MMWRWCDDDVTMMWRWCDDDLGFYLFLCLIYNSFYTVQHPCLTNETTLHGVSLYMQRDTTQRRVHAVGYCDMHGVSLFINVLTRHHAETGACRWLRWHPTAMKPKLARCVSGYIARHTKSICCSLCDGTTANGVSVAHTARYSAATTSYI